MEGEGEDSHQYQFYYGDSKQDVMQPEYKHYDNFVEYMRIETRKQPLVIVNGAMETKYVLKQKVSRVTTRSIL